MVWASGTLLAWGIWELCGVPRQLAEHKQYLIEQGTWTELREHFPTPLGLRIRGLGWIALGLFGLLAKLP